MAQPERLVWRSELGWSSRSPAGYATPQRGLVIHYDSNDQNLANRDHSACVDYWQWCRRFHTRNRGWTDVGYSFMACPHGYVMEGRGLYRSQAAQRGANSTHYSVTLACGPTDEIPAAQIEAVRQLRAWLMEPDTSISGDVFGHRDFNSTSCPGDKGYRMVQGGVFSQPPGSNIDMPDSGGSSGGGGAREYVAEDGDGLLEPYEHGEKIAELQAALGIEDDTYYGPDTISAVRSYQRENGLQVDGIAGPETLGHLGMDTPDGGAAGALFPAWPGVYLDQPPVKQTRACETWQQRMRDRGWVQLDGRAVVVDGWYGRESQRVCKLFQQEKGLKVDGIVGPKTWRASWTAPVT